MSLISLILALVLVGFVLWVLQTYIPMDAKVKSFLSVVVIVLLVLWVLQGLGLLTGGPTLRLR